jgi:phosphohistidine swiveling domain-containing protein
MSFYQQEEIELLKTKDVVAHTEEYSWLKNSYAGVKKLPVSFFEDRKKELDSELENKEAVRIDLVKKKKLEVKEKYQISDEVIHIARSLSRAVEWQDDRKEFIFRNLAYKDLLLHEVARRTKNDHADLLHFGYQEIAQMLSDDNYEEQIRSRRHGFGFIIEKTTDVVDSEESRRLWNLYGQEDVAEDVKEFGGIVASKGDGKIVRGRVRVLFRPHQGYFEKGEILVAPMTSPEYVFAMKQSAAIVTDAGGLTSHAAIVSRELGKPCIVGSKIATQVLHDGDLVEVDANNGVVRKL